jgi:hypothetical protein
MSLDSEIRLILGVSTVLMLLLVAIHVWRHCVLPRYCVHRHGIKVKLCRWKYGHDWGYGPQYRVCRCEKDRQVIRRVYVTEGIFSIWERY